LNEQYSDVRRYARFELFEYVVIESEELIEATRAVVVDIGLGGLQLRSRQSMPLGHVCVLRVGQDTGKSLILRGEVRYSTPIPDSDLWAIGFRFIPSSHEERVAIAEYVHSVFQRQGDRLVQ